MVSQQEIVQRQRKSIAQARQQARTIGAREKISKSKLLKRGLAEREKSKSLTERRTQVSKQELASISSQEKAFETQVAQIAPKLSTPQYKAQALQTAKKAISGSLSSVKSQLVSARAVLERAREAGKKPDKYQEKIAELQAQERVYTSALKGSQADIIKGYYSGQTSSLASYESSKASRPYEKVQAKQRWAEGQGFKSYRELETAIKAQSLPAITSAVKIEQARGTYDPSTGTYIDKYGQGMSMAQAPKGVTIVGQPTFDFTTPTNIRDILKQSAEFKESIISEQVKVPTISQETKRYQEIGYSKSDASKLAKESIRQGGMSFTPERAKDITRPVVVTKVRDVGTYVKEKAKDTISYFKGDEVKTKEIYSPSVSGFVTASAMGQGTDIFVRTTTEEERKKIQSAKDKGNLQLNIEERKKIKEFDTQVKEYEKDYKELTAYEIPKFEQDNSINGKFDFNSLSVSKQKEYNSLIKEAKTTYNKYTSLYEQREKYVGDTSVTFKSKNIFGKTTYEKKVPVSELITPFGYVTQKFKTMTEAAGEGVGKLYEKTAEKIGGIPKSPFIATGMLVRGEISGKEFVSGFKETKPDVVYDLVTKEARIPTEKDLTKDKSSPYLFVQPEEVSKVTATTLEFGAYTIPYVGTGLVISHLGETTGKYDYSPSKFWEESTTGEKIGVGLGVAYLGLPPIYRGAKKVDKYFTKPIVKEIPQGYKIIRRGDEFMGKRIRISKADELGAWRFKAEIKPSERYLKKTTQEVIQKPESTFIEIAQPVIKEEEQVIKSYPMIFESPSLIKETTLISKKGKKLFDTKLDKIVEYKYTKPKVTEPFAQVPVVADKPFTLRSAKLTKEGKLGEPKYVSVIGEEGKFIPVEDISKLDKVSEYTFLETLKKGKGREPLYIKETEQAQIGLRQELVVTKPIGKKTALKRTTAIVEELEPLGTTRLFDITAGTKDVSKAFARARGRIDTISGKYILLPPVEKGAKEIGKIYVGGKKTLLSSTFKLEEVQALKYIPKEPPKPKITKPTLEIPTQELPLMVGGTGLKDIKYAGAGLYEQVETTISPTSLSPITSYATLDTTKDRDVVLTDLSTRTRTEFKPAVSLDLKTKSIVIPIERVIPKLKERVVERVKEVQKIKQAPRLASLLKTAQAQVPREILKPREVIKPKIPPKTPTPKIPKILIIPPKSSLTKRLAKKIEEDGFEAVGFRFGKEVSLGKAETQTKSEKLLSDFLKKTLGASGYISKDKVKLKASELKTFGMGEFRVGKRSEFLVVERKSKRLRKSTTGKLIQPFRFGGGSKSLLGGLK